MKLRGGMVDVFRGLILSVPTAFPTTNGKAMNIMINPTIPEATAGNWISMLVLGSGAAAAVWFNRLCARDAVVRADPTDLQVTADSLKAAVREAQRTAAELRTELDEQRKELADAQVARAQLQGMLQETERRLADARQIIDLQREELSAARTERERVARLFSRLTTRHDSRRRRVVSRKESLVDTGGHRRDLAENRVCDGASACDGRNSGLVSDIPFRS